MIVDYSYRIRRVDELKFLGSNPRHPVLLMTRRTWRVERAPIHQRTSIAKRKIDAAKDHFAKSIQIEFSDRRRAPERTPPNEQPLIFESSHRPV